MTGDLQPFGIFSVLGGSLRLGFRGIGATFLPAFLPALASAIVAASLVAEPGPESPMPLNLGMLWSIGFDLVVGTLVTGVLCLITLDLAIGKHHTMGQYLRQAVRQFLPLLVFGFVISIAIGIGFLFLIVPGLYLAARYLPYVPAIVFEDTGWSGISRAESLTRGYRWPVVATLLLFGGLIIAILLVVVLPLAGLAGSLGPAAGVLGEALLTALIYVMVSAFSTTAYLRLRALREGVSAAAIAATVD